MMFKRFLKTVNLLSFMKATGSEKKSACIGKRFEKN